MDQSRRGNRGKEGQAAAAPGKKPADSITVKPEPEDKPAFRSAKPMPGLDGSQDNPVSVDSSGEEDYLPPCAALGMPPPSPDPAASSSVSVLSQLKAPTNKRKASDNRGPGFDEEQEVRGQENNSPACGSPAGKSPPNMKSSPVAAIVNGGPGASADTTPAGTSPTKLASTPVSVPKLFDGNRPLYHSSLAGPSYQTPTKTSTCEDLLSSGVSAPSSKKRKTIPMTASEYRDSLKISKLNISRLESHGNMIKNVVESTLDVLAHTSHDYVVDEDEYRGVLYPLVTEMMVAIKQKREDLYHSRVRVSGDM